MKHKVSAFFLVALVAIFLAGWAMVPAKEGPEVKFTAWVYLLAGGQRHVLASRVALAGRNLVRVGQ